MNSESKHMVLEVNYGLWSINLICEWALRDQSHLRVHEKLCLSTISEVVLISDYASYSPQKQGKFFSSSYGHAVVVKTTESLKGLS